jgi:uncharacterized membrane protein
MSMKDLPQRSLVKGISWRVIGTLDTFFLAWIFFGTIKIAVPIALTEILTKILLYFLHERIWNLFVWGRVNGLVKKRRSLAKGVSWRFFGSMDTFFLGLIFSGNALKSAKLGLTEILTKVVLYYLHERIWTLINWGRVVEEPVHNFNS